MMDLDKFSEKVKEEGWSEWRPNLATATLTELVYSLARKWGAVVVWGLDEERGTEEAVLEIPFVEPEELLEDLEEIKRRLNELGVGITIVAIKDFVSLKRARDRREAYYSTPGRRRAKKMLEKLKRRGGNVVYVPRP